MWQIVKNVFSPSQYMPHGHCYLWQTPLVWLHVVSDLLIALAYFSIPAMLIYFVFKRRDVPFLGIFALFGAFIIFCGMGHLLDIWTLWHSAYWLSGIEKAITALISCYTAGQMVTLLPQFLSLKTPDQLRCAYDELEVRVRERTAKLAETNAIMQAEISERIAAESALRLSEAREREKAQQLEVTLRQLKSTQAQIVQNEKMASLGQMVAGVAHEINNPVSFIYGNVTPAIEYSHYLLSAIDLYQQHYPEPPAVIKEQIEAVEFDFIKEDFIKLLESMKTGAERIKQIVLSLRNFSHLDEYDLKPANLNQDIESTLMILQHRLKSQPRRCAIEVIREYGKLPLVECYPGQLNQVFMNLLSNAIDALEEKLQRDPNFTPQIRICTEVKNNMDKSNIKSALVRIADNGAGISEKVKQRIFDPFFTTKPVGKGTGLGLSISHQIIVEKHQGRLECHSQLGQGTEFLIELNFCAYNTDSVFALKR